MGGLVPQKKIWASWLELQLVQTKLEYLLLEQLSIEKLEVKMVDLFLSTQATDWLEQWILSLEKEGVVSEDI